MNWKNVRKLADLDLLFETEKSFSISFPAEYVELVKNYNAGIPEKRRFSFQGKSYTFERLISANGMDCPNIMSAEGWIDQEACSTMIPIALNTGDDIICLDFKESTIAVVMIDFETRRKMHLADSLGEFLLMLS